MTLINYSTVPTRLRWLDWPTLLSAALLTHFLVSVGAWLIWFDRILRDPNMRDELLPSLWTSLPAFMMCAFSGVLFVLAMRGRSVARWGVLFALAATALLFFIDVHFGRWQIHTIIATTDYWNGGGKENYYFTWWWYDDRWFR